MLVTDFVALDSSISSTLTGLFNVYFTKWGLVAAIVPLSLSKRAFPPSNDTFVYTPQKPSNSNLLKFLAAEVSYSPFVSPEFTSSKPKISFKEPPDDVPHTLLGIPIEIRYRCYEYLLGDHRTIEIERSSMTDTANVCMLIVLAETYKQLEEEIEEWWKSNPKLRLSTQVDVFIPESTTFTVDLRRTCTYNSDHWRLSGRP
jgi:hypothetical protein